MNFTSKFPKITPKGMTRNNNFNSFNPYFVSNIIKNEIYWNIARNKYAKVMLYLDWFILFFWRPETKRDRSVPPELVIPWINPTKDNENIFKFFFALSIFLLSLITK